MIRSVSTTMKTPLMETGCAVILARMFQAFKKSVLNEYMDQGPNTHLYGKTAKF